MIKKIFHGSRDCFDNILLYKCCDIGFHCGTLEQALFRIVDINKCSSNDLFDKSYVYEIEIDVNDKNVINLPDCICWADLKTIKKHLILEYPSMKIDKIKSIEKLREYILDKGFKYIRYMNEIEGDGSSYILLEDHHKFERYTVREVIKKMSMCYGKR